jgi:hypothetical protein
MSPSAFRLAADAIVVIHFAFVLFVVLGGLLVLRWRWLAWLHLPAAAWGVLIEYANWICPLTPLENYLRERGGVAGYAGDFIEHYVLPLLYPARLTRSAQLLLGSLALALNALIYWYVIRRGKSVT